MSRSARSRFNEAAQLAETAELLHVSICVLCYVTLTHPVCRFNKTSKTTASHQCLPVLVNP